ncbi:hypothetical protein KO500_00435 [Cellulophaga baltica]|uniref:hypothetical protein n=1 Tax=Cellulophaga TaxID=104264 RepID=UPI001C06EA2C|nr:MULTISPECIES: hypothetical protein [Cellulophaga]MBU2994878.1 hypothetical protein [Cellulophaga baltica]MDO6766272.1 hypothetical protein [Cellulophaga sp. 1_MG-2023]
MDKKKDIIDELFDHLNGSFDYETPSEGHQQRFLDKLNGVKAIEPTIKKSNTYKYLAFAACFVMLLSLGYTYINTSTTIEQQVVEISPEISNTEFYFVNIIEQEVAKLKSENSPATKKIIADTMLQLKKLETNYKGLENDLINGGNSKLILSAMIINFQTRIDLLEDVLKQVEEIKNIDHENTII